MATANLVPGSWSAAKSDTAARERGRIDNRRIQRAYYDGRPGMSAISIEDLAATSDDAAVRRRFDARNLVWQSILLGPFLVATFIDFGMSMGRRRTWIDVTIALS